MAEQKACERQVEDNEMTYVELILSVVPVVNRSHNVEVVQLPQFEHEQQYHGQQSRYDISYPSSGMLVEELRVIRITVVITNQAFHIFEGGNCLRSRAKTGLEVIGICCNDRIILSGNSHIILAQ